jgi:diaminopimelate epimerase
VAVAALAFCKAHAYGNDFLYVSDALAAEERTTVARRLCDRHRGIGADGLILYTLTPTGAAMRLINADGSPAELSGNGLRGLAAIVIRERASRGGAAPDPHLAIDTHAGARHLTLERVEGSRYHFDTDMGVPEALEQRTLEVGGESVRVSVLSMGNPQCVLLGPMPDDQRFARLGAAIERHPVFAEGTNVEFAEVIDPGRVRIRIWERGVGPTESSGTGSCAAAIAAAAHGGADRVVEVVAPGGTQTVAWRESGVHLVGWAELICDGTWLADL